MVSMSIQKYMRCSEDLDNQESKLLKQVSDEIMELILQQLNTLDYLAFRQVCHRWRALSKRCPPAPQLPWLLYNSQPCYIQDHCFRSFLGDLKARSSDPQKLFSESICLGSVEGWMIMAARIHNYSPIVNLLLNPITGSRVELPLQSTIPIRLSNELFFIKKAVASFEQPRLDHCIVACLCSDHYLAFCRPIDNSWTLVEARDLFTNAEIIDGKLYAASMSDPPTLLVFNIKGVEYTKERMIELSDFSGGMYLAKDVATKDLFIVGIFVRTRSSNQTKWGLEFRVFKLECNKDDDPHCVQVHDLGDRTLFLSDFVTKIGSSSRDLRCSDDNRLENNCVYYAFHPRESRNAEFGVYFMTNKSVKHLTHPGCLSQKAQQRQCHRASLLWFESTPL